MRMHQYSKCVMGPQLFLPMEIASIMLLATASAVLLCTLVRCCCRHFLMPMPSSSTAEITLDEQAELSDASDDEAHRTARQPSATAGQTTASSTTTASSAAVATMTQPASSGKRGGASSRAMAAVVADDDEDLPAYSAMRD